MKLVWMIIAGVAIVLAAVLMWRRDFNSAFVVAAVGSVAWFLNYRAQMRDVATRVNREREALLQEDDEEN